MNSSTFSPTASDCKVWFLSRGHSQQRVKELGERRQDTSPAHWHGGRPAASRIYTVGRGAEHPAPAGRDTAARHLLRSPQT